MDKQEQIKSMTDFISFFNKELKTDPWYGNHFFIEEYQTEMNGRDGLVFKNYVLNYVNGWTADIKMVESSWVNYFDIRRKLISEMNTFIHKCGYQGPARSK